MRERLLVRSEKDDEFEFFDWIHFCLYEKHGEVEVQPLKMEHSLLFHFSNKGLTKKVRMGRMHIIDPWVHCAPLLFSLKHSLKHKSENNLELVETPKMNSGGYFWLGWVRVGLDVWSDSVSAPAARAFFVAGGRHTQWAKRRQRQRERGDDQQPVAGRWKGQVQGSKRTAWAKTRWLVLGLQRDGQSALSGFLLWLSVGSCWLQTGSILAKDFGASKLLGLSPKRQVAWEVQRAKAPRFKNMFCRAAWLSLDLGAMLASPILGSSVVILKPYWDLLVGQPSGWAFGLLGVARPLQSWWSRVEPGRTKPPCGPHQWGGRGMKIWGEAFTSARE